MIQLDSDKKSNISNRVIDLQRPFTNILNLFSNYLNSEKLNNIVVDPTLNRLINHYSNDNENYTLNDLVSNYISRTRDYDIDDFKIFTQLMFEENI